jgi:hypothetical protein
LRFYDKYIKNLLIISVFYVVFFQQNIFLISQNGSLRWTEPKNISVLNSEADEFAPHFNPYLNILYFNSDRDGKSYFYFADFIKTDSLSEPKFLKSEINVSGRNQSYLTCPSPTEAYYSQYRISGKQSYLNIYKTIFKKNNWTSGLLVDSLSSDSFCSHVTVSPDGNVMIFASTKNSSQNDIDLWMSYRNENGNWGAPFALDELNSQGNEISPFLLSDDTLYFSSDGYEGPGAYDIYTSIRTGGKWNRPKPLYELNTEFNESDFCIIQNKYAVFSSDRPGGSGKLDLYMSYPVIHQISENIQQKREISIKTQATNIFAEKKSVISLYPGFHFFAGKSFESFDMKFSNIIDSLLYIYPENINDFLKNNPEEILILDSTEYNNNILLYFISRGMSKDRFIFRKSYDKSDIIKCKLLSGNQLPTIEISSDSYNYKPPVLEFSIESRENYKINSHILNFITNKNVHKIELSDVKLPFRDIISIVEYDDEVYLSDSIIINYKIIENGQTENDINRVLFVSRQQIKEQKTVNSEENIFKEYFLILPDKIFLNSDYFPNEYFRNIIDNSNNAKSIRVVYYNDEMNSQANKVKELLVSKLSNKKKPILVEKENYSENRNFSKNISQMIIRIEVMIR